ncbi:MAG: hypothetical protein JEZ02_05965 [Desulfatibacillum sp.]|nr:hypothetical protein [Desulfatibacillum sp.]
MYTHNEKQLTFVEFTMPFGGKLSPGNRWVRLASMVPWAYVEEEYQKSLSDSGHSGLPVAVQAALLQAHAPKAPVKKCRKNDCQSETLHAVYDRKSGKQKKKAQERLKALLAVESLISTGAKLTEARELVGKQMGFSALSIYRWGREVESLSKTDWEAALVPGYVGCRQEAELTPRPGRFLRRTI